jgi:hypothetical protein
MSLGTLATLGTERDVRRVKRKTIGKAKAAAPDEDAKLRDLLVAALPTELVTGYTFLVTAIVGLIDPKKNDHPDDFEILRWTIFALLVTATFFFVADGIRRKRAKPSWTPFPMLEASTAALAALVWGLSVPDSPLQIELNGDNRLLVPMIILVLGGTMYGRLALGLRAPRKG